MMNFEQDLHYALQGSKKFMNQLLITALEQLYCSLFWPTTYKQKVKDCVLTSYNIINSPNPSLTNTFIFTLKSYSFFFQLPASSFVESKESETNKLSSIRLVLG